MKTYEFPTYFVTTDEILEGAISVVDVTPEEVVAIEEGASVDIVDGDIIIE